jgi:hypothetical protein
VVEEPFEEEKPEPKQEHVPAPDEFEWWEKQLGLPLLAELYTDFVTGR